MSELSPELLAMVEATRAVEAPSPDDRQRVRIGLGARLTALAAAGAVSTVTAKVAAADTAVKTAGLLGSVGKLVLVTTIVAGAGGAGLVAWRASEPPTSPAMSAPVPAAPPPAATAARHEPSHSAPVAPPSAEPTRDPPRAMPSSRPVSKSSPSLERELDLLRSAQRAVDGGEAHKALTILQQYSSEFPEGMLREEYHAMQIVALCAAGNRTSAREAADRFVRARPGSPLSRRVRTACGGLDPRE